MDAIEVEHAVRHMEGVKSRASRTFGVDVAQVHLGHVALQSMSEHADYVLQIDAVSDISQTFGTIRKDVIRLAVSMARAGLEQGDVVLLLTPNHLKTCLPIYASLVNGYSVIPIDSSCRQRELEYYINLTKPKIIFCIKENETLVQEVVKNNGNCTKMIVLDDVKNDTDAFVLEHSVCSEDVDSFKPPTFDLSTTAWLMPTSGTTGKPKVAVTSHRNLLMYSNYMYYYFKTFPKPTKMVFQMSSPQWFTGMSLYLGSILYVFTRVLTTAPITPEFCGRIMQKFKPTFMITSPTLLTQFHYSACVDFRSLECILVGGSAISVVLEKTFKSCYPNIYWISGYGMTELSGLCFSADQKCPLSSLGKEFRDRFEYRLVDPSNEKLINEANVIGELWVKKDIQFEGYYNNPEETINTMSEDGYLKTGDLVYKNSEGYYFFVERLKLMFKYEGTYLYPTEIENTLRGHPAVAEVVATAMPDPTYGDIPCAVVVNKEGCKAKASELYEIVAEELSDGKRLRGGILFVDTLPLTPSYKIDRVKVRTMALERKRDFIHA